MLKAQKSALNAGSAENSTILQKKKKKTQKTSQFSYVY